MTFNKKVVYIGALALALGIPAVLYTFPHQASASALTTLAGRDLALGDQGNDVTDLQGLLGEQGYLDMPVGVPFGYFGPLTKAALSRYQASIGVPATGYYGPMTRGKIVQVFTANGWMAILLAGNR